MTTQAVHRLCFSKEEISERPAQEFKVSGAGNYRSAASLRSACPRRSPSSWHRHRGEQGRQGGGDPPRGTEKAGGNSITLDATCSGPHTTSAPAAGRVPGGPDQSACAARRGAAALTGS